ncbi:MAG TPA: hypothetical protein VHV99_08145 [Paraburkholderia sp.]|jgi:hypothetical protein|nr:hypothetical protein [Paraburkholderia sp.]
MTLELHMTRSRGRFLFGAGAALVTLGCALHSSYGYAGAFDDLKQSLAKSLNDAAKKNVDAALGNTPPGSPAQVQSSGPAGTGPAQPQAADAIQPVRGNAPGASSQATGEAPAGCAKRRLSSPMKAFIVRNDAMIMTIVNDCDSELTVMTHEGRVNNGMCIASWVRAHGVKSTMPVARLCNTRMPLPKTSPYAVPCACPDGTNIDLNTMPLAD